MSRPRIINNLPRFLADTDRKAAATCLRVLILGASEASLMTPIHTSVLLNSQYRKIEKRGGTIRGEVGYTAAYALPVHDPNNTQNFRRATAKKEFLKKGFEQNTAKIAEIIRKGMHA